MSRVNEGSHSFASHPHIIYKSNEPYLPLLPAADHHHTLTATSSLSS